jgi:hypothetical protein
MCNELKTGWQPINTAPTDGTFVDLWMVGPLNTGARRADCWFKNGKWLTDYFDRGDDGPEFYIGDVPTHWMPLPGAPITDVQDGHQR